MLDDDGGIDAWFAAPGDGEDEYDWVTYRHSDDGGKTWSDEKVVLSPSPNTPDALSICDPDAFYYDGYYYLGYTSTINKNEKGLCNSVFLARSKEPDGPYEKWNGSGYPYGLAGEDIPLSARIMAVADVFDALVSKRSYKEGFPVEKAFAIIEEGIGTHCDPQVARAFLHARDKARAVAEKSNEKKRLEEEAAQSKEADAGSNTSTKATS